MIHDLVAAEAGPRHVRRAGGHGRAHLALRSIVPGHQVEIEIGIGRAVGHHPAGGNHAAEAGRINNIACRQIAEIVAGGGDDEHALVIKRVDRIGPGAA